MRDDLGRKQNNQEIFKNTYFVRKLCCAVISGHKDFNSLYAANDTIQEKFTVNILGAPNNSTTTVIIVT